MSSISLAKAARAYAFIRRRDYVIPDVRAVCHDVLRHHYRRAHPAGRGRGYLPKEIIADILNNVIVP